VYVDGGRTIQAFLAAGLIDSIATMLRLKGLKWKVKLHFVPPRVFLFLSDRRGFQAMGSGIRRQNREP
jgi:hypothetical protein